LQETDFKFQSCGICCAVFLWCHLNISEQVKNTTMFRMSYCTTQPYNRKVSVSSNPAGWSFAILYIIADH
jgi:hypothetical protein